MFNTLQKKTLIFLLSIQTENKKKRNILENEEKKSSIVSKVFHGGITTIFGYLLYRNFLQDKSKNDIHNQEKEKEKKVIDIKTYNELKKKIHEKLLLQHMIEKQNKKNNRKKQQQLSMFLNDNNDIKKSIYIKEQLMDIKESEFELTDNEDNNNKDKKK